MQDVVEHNSSFKQLNLKPFLLRLIRLARFDTRLSPFDNPQELLAF